MFAKLGADAGFDSIGESNYALPLSRHLNRIAEAGALGKTIIYNINPKDNAMIASMLGNFQDSLCAGKLQLGAAWWFMDSYEGMLRQLEAVSSMSLLGRFVGMLTGREMERGFLPRDMALVGKLVADVSYYNAKSYFDL